MTLPAPPTRESFRVAINSGQLIALRALRTGNYARQGEADRPAIWVDVWVLTGAEAGKFFGDSVNTSRLGRQFMSSAGNGQVYYGRLVGETVGQGTSYVLKDPQPGDETLIQLHKDALAADPYLGSSGSFSLKGTVAAAQAPAAQQAAPAPQAQAQPQQQYAAPPLPDNEPPF
jgi:hypothetical protein